MRIFYGSLLLAVLLVQAISTQAAFGDTTKTSLKNTEGVFAENKLNNDFSVNDVLAEKLNNLNRHAPFEFVFNDITATYIKMYTSRKSATPTILALGELYFPIFERILAEYGLPHQLKYLAVVESALQAKARSYASATGLWQFMPTTGKLYGLKMNSFVDERSDPIKATHAACRYLKNLFNIFGSWDLALSAYNSGPATIHRAIRQAGGKRNFWEIYDYLPRETKGYVPAFIAVNFIMNYYEDYGINLRNPEITHCDIESIELLKNANLSDIARAIDEPIERLRFLNPSLKTNTIPASGQPFTLVLPKEKIDLFAMQQDQLASPSLTEVKSHKKGKKSAEKTGFTHSVKRGETLSSIGRKYHCSVEDLKHWNKVKHSRLALGQRLVIKGNVAEETETQLAEKQEKQNPSTTTQTADEANEVKQLTEKFKPEEPAVNLGEYATYHVVQRGDTLWSISRKYDGLTVTELKKLNNLNTGSLVPGQKLIVGIGG